MREYPVVFFKVLEKKRYLANPSELHRNQMIVIIRLFELLKSFKYSNNLSIPLCAVEISHQINSSIRNIRFDRIFENTSDCIRIFVISTQ